MNWKSNSAEQAVGDLVEVRLFAHKFVNLEAIEQYEEVQTV